MVGRINRSPSSSEWIGHIYALYPDDVQGRVLEEHRRMRSRRGGLESGADKAVL